MPNSIKALLLSAFLFFIFTVSAETSDLQTAQLPSGLPILILNDSSLLQGSSFLDGRYIEYFADSSGNWNVHDITSERLSHKFTPLPVDSFGIPMDSLIPRSNFYWLHLRIKNEARSLSSEWCFRYYAREVHMYIFNDTGYVYSKTGRDFKLSEKDMKFKEENLLRVVVPYNQSRDIFFKVKNPDESFIVMMPGLVDIARLRAADQVERYVQGIFLGIFLVIGIYNLLIFFATGEKAYLFAALPLFFVGLYYLKFTGYGFELFWPSVPELKGQAIKMFLTVLPGFFLCSVRERISKYQKYVSRMEQSFRLLFVAQHDIAA